MNRGFKIVSKYRHQGLTLPFRATEQAAGYDLASAVDMTLPSIWRLNFIKILWLIKHQRSVATNDLTAAQQALTPFLIPTGIKAYMQKDEVLIIANRSSNPLKRGLYLPNGIGVIDADYYDNPNNEGEIFVQMINFGLTDRQIHRGDRIAQGLFMPFLVADGDEGQRAKPRTGGFGSSGQ